MILFLILLSASASAVNVTTHYTQSQSVHKFKLVCSLSGYTVQGMVWSECKSGSVKLLGCVLESGEKLNFGEIYTDNNAQYRCEKVGEEVRMTPIACILKDKVLSINQGAFAGKFFYLCTRRPDGAIGLDITGCKDESLGILVPFKGTFRRKNFQFMCDTDGEKAFEVGVGCYVQGKKLVELGQTFHDGDFYYKCSRKGKRGIKTEAVGCTDDKGQLVEVGKTFRLQTIVYECVENDGNVDIEAVGCVVKNSVTGTLQEYKFGEKWYESYKDGLGYRMVCVQENEEIGPKIIECIASTPQTQKVLEVGCGSEFEGKAFVCVDTNEGVMAKLKSVPKGSTYMKLLEEHSVKEC